MHIHFHIQLCITFIRSHSWNVLLSFIPVNGSVFFFFCNKDKKVLNEILLSDDCDKRQKIVWFNHGLWLLYEWRTFFCYSLPNYQSIMNSVNMFKKTLPKYKVKGNTYRFLIRFFRLSRTSLRKMIRCRPKKFHSNSFELKGYRSSVGFVDDTELNLRLKIDSESHVLMQCLWLFRMMITYRETDQNGG